MYGTNFWKANLSGQDFTTVVSNTYPLASTFVESNLSNSNFEGVDLSHKEQYLQVFENKAYLTRGVTQSLEKEAKIKKDLFGEFSNLKIISTEVRVNDLAVTYIFFNSFGNANLENANFKNADLSYASFYSANLTNADLSGADLSNANLQGALLDGAILNCLNHPICLNE